MKINRRFAQAERRFILLKRRFISMSFEGGLSI